MMILTTPHSKSSRPVGFNIGLTALSLTTLISLVNGQTQIYPSPTDIEAGPTPPALTGSASGSWATPTASVTLANGQVVPPASETGMGRQAHLRGPTDFCLFLPPNPVTENLVDAEADAVAYCFNPVNNTRPMPDGFVQTAHFRSTEDYVQVSGTFDWRKMNINPYDCGGEYDNHGPGGVGNPVGAHFDNGTDFFQFLGGCDTPLVGQFVVRSCFGPNSYPYCRNTFDLMGSLWVAPGDYQQPGFTSCQGDADLPVGVYNSSYTFAQGQANTPPPVPAPSSSMCSTTVSPSASGVTYSWAQTGYAQGNPNLAAASPTSATSSPSSSTASSSGSRTITSAPSVTATGTSMSGGNGMTSSSSSRRGTFVGAVVGMLIVGLTIGLVA